MLLFQYDSYTILFVSTSTVPHCISSTYAFCSLSPFQRVSCTHNMSNPLRSIRSATSLPLPVMVPTFNVATLSLIFLAFFLSSFLSFLLLHCFPLLLCIQVACPWRPVTGNGRCFPGPQPIRYEVRFYNAHWKIFGYVLRRMPFLSQPSPFIRANWDRHQGCSNLNNLRGWVLLSISPPDKFRREIPVFKRNIDRCSKLYDFIGREIGFIFECLRLDKDRLYDKPEQ